MGLPDTDPISQLSLPPGFRFYPTDEELMVQYLCRKIAGQEFSLQVIGDIDLYKFDPWVLPSKAMFGEKEWYFFSPRDRKYPNGSRPNRVAGSGYWKATGTDKVITTEGRKVGIKKALVFYVGKAPKGTKTNWIMHEYRLSDPPRNNRSAKLDDWVLCRIYKKNSGGAKFIPEGPGTEQSQDSRSPSSSHYDDMLESLPEINDQFFALPQADSLKNLQIIDEKPSIESLIAGNFDWATLAAVQSVPDIVTAGEAQAQVQPQENVNARNSIYNDVFVPSFCNVDEEVQSGLKRTRVEHSGFFQHNPNGVGQSCSGSFAPFDIRYPNQYGRFGFHE